MFASYFCFAKALLCLLLVDLSSAGEQALSPSPLAHLILGLGDPGPPE